MPRRPLGRFSSFRDRRDSSPGPTVGPARLPHRSPVLGGKGRVLLPLPSGSSPPPQAAPLPRSTKPGGVESARPLPARVAALLR